MYQPSGLQNISIKEVWEPNASLQMGELFEGGMGVGGGRLYEFVTRQFFLA